MDERTGGIDLASEEHRLVVVAADGCKIEERRIAHSEEGLAVLLRRLLLRQSDFEFVRDRPHAVDALGCTHGCVLLRVRPDVARPRDGAVGGRNADVGLVDLGVPLELAPYRITERIVARRRVHILSLLCRLARTLASAA